MYTNKNVNFFSVQIWESDFPVGQDSPIWLARKIWAADIARCSLYSRIFQEQWDVAGVSKCCEVGVVTYLILRILTQISTFQYCTYEFEGVYHFKSFKRRWEWTDESIFGSCVCQRWHPRYRPRFQEVENMPAASHLLANLLPNFDLALLFSLFLASSRDMILFMERIMHHSGCPNCWFFPTINIFWGITSGAVFSHLPYHVSFLIAMCFPFSFFSRSSPDRWFKLALREVKSSGEIDYHQ